MDPPVLIPQSLPQQPHWFMSYGFSSIPYDNHVHNIIVNLFHSQYPAGNVRELTIDINTPEFEYMRDVIHYFTAHN